MALFGKKTETKVEKAVSTAPKALATDHNLDFVIQNPRLTEKSVKQGENNVYTFVVAPRATKYQVRDAVKAIYNVTPVKVNIVNKKPAERLQGSRNRMVHKAGIRKAYVYLKKGDTINLV
jgi:large subunit ribosomal protein L23